MPAIMDIDSAPVARTRDAATQTDPTEISGPVWVCFTDPETLRRWWWNNLGHEWFYAEAPGPWKRYRSAQHGANYWVKQQNGVPWDHRPSFWGS